MKAIDEEIREIIDRNYQRAETLLKENEDKLHAMAKALMKFETIDAGQIDDIMEGREPRAPEGWTDDNNGPKNPPTGKAESSDSAQPPIGGPASEH